MYGRPPVDRLARRLRTDGEAKILFLSNHGAARALIAESIVRRYSASGFTAIAAGVSPEGAPHPMAEELIRAYRLPAPRSRPISFEEALDAEANDADFVVALWDRSCGEPCPTRYRDALAASWDVPDPRRPYNAGAGIVGSRMGFVRAYLGLRQRIERFFNDISEEQRSIRGAPGALEPLDDAPVAPTLPDSEPVAEPPSNLLKPAKKRIEAKKPSWSFGGILGRRRLQEAGATEPLSLGRAQLVREQRRRAG